MVTPSRRSSAKQVGKCPVTSQLPIAEGRPARACEDRGLPSPQRAEKKGGRGGPGGRGQLEGNGVKLVFPGPNPPRAAVGQRSGPPPAPCAQWGRSICRAHRTRLLEFACLASQSRPATPVRSTQRAGIYAPATERQRSAIGQAQLAVVAATPHQLPPRPCLSASRRVSQEPPGMIGLPSGPRGAPSWGLGGSVPEVACGCLVRPIINGELRAAIAGLNPGIQRNSRRCGRHGGLSSHARREAGWDRSASFRLFFFCQKPQGLAAGHRDAAADRLAGCCVAWLGQPAGPAASGTHNQLHKVRITRYRPPYSRPALPCPASMVFCLSWLRFRFKPTAPILLSSPCLAS
ncbi:hypothetical protein BT67DRAFT_127495 [Trichocladium antarcticum]|uniref:Uncharacterized protein n=1 Tax=Trichocladium antarcticum TaxID=1450529 RepID=A0AAN6URQ4_9PEZI|nr:hypothetical protein BT67DRAFT_127495 [Trichocladium antarcticum]